MIRGKHAVTSCNVARVNTGDITVRAERAEDRARIREVTASAFSHDPGVADLVDLIRASSGYMPELSLVAEMKGDIVGHVMLSHADLIDEWGERHQILTLSPLSVDPSHQRQGIGSELVRNGVERAGALGEPLVVLEGSPDYYPRFGFRPAAQFGVAIDLPEWGPPEAAMVYPLSAYVPTVRGKLNYPRAFRAIEDLQGTPGRRT